MPQQIESRLSFGGALIHNDDGVGMDGAPIRDLTCLSAFTGLGGMDLGLEAAGFTHVGCIEWDEAARRSLKANRGESWPLLEPGDIEVVAKHLTLSRLGLQTGELDLLVGAPPCQPYSKAAQWAPTGRKGMNDRRGKYLEDLLELAQTFHPKVILLENVNGFVSGATSALPHIHAALDRIGRSHGSHYRVDHRLVDAADVGAPQHRTRAIVIATRIDEPFQWPGQRSPTTAWDAIGDLDHSDEDIPVARGKWADLLPTIPEGENYLWHTDRGGGEPLFGWRTRYWSFLLKLAKDRPSWTLPANPGPAVGPFHWDNRPLSIPEMLRLQTFPSSWVVEGRTRAERVRQVGNATPPLLAEALGRRIATLVGASVPSDPLALAIPHRGSTPEPKPPRPLPTKYLEQRGVHPAHPGTGLACD